MSANNRINQESVGTHPKKAARHNTERKTTSVNHKTNSGDQRARTLFGCAKNNKAKKRTTTKKEQPKTKKRKEEED